MLGWSIGEVTDISGRDVQSQHAAGSSDDQTGERDDRNERGMLLLDLNYEISTCS